LVSAGFCKNFLLFFWLLVLAFSVGGTGIFGTLVSIVFTKWLLHPTIQFGFTADAWLVWGFQVMLRPLV
jgi:hypothetical protein